MTETTDQIENPVLPEPQPVELSAPAATSEIPHPNGVPDEATLTSEITELWRLHTDYKGSIKSQAENLRSLRAELGKKLTEMKQSLARPGRSGQWSAWLKEREISRATADRLVNKHERSFHPELNCLNEAIQEPTEEQIQSLFGKIAPKLNRVLRTPTSVYRFIDLLASSFALDRKESEQGFIVLKPSWTAAVEQSVPQDAQAEPAPVMAEVVAEGNVESTGTSMVL